MNLVPALTYAEAALPEAVGHLFDCTILASDALRPLADLWCRRAKTCLLRIGGVVRPLVARAEAARLARSPGLRPASPDVALCGHVADGPPFSWDRAGVLCA